MTVNTLLKKSKNRFGAPAFDKIKEEDYLPAFREGIKEGEEEINAISENPESPTFENTIAALEYAGQTLSRVSEIFFNLNEAETSDRMQKMAEEISPELTQFHLTILLNKKLFSRIKEVYDSRKELGLNEEDMRLLTETYKGFARSGACLSDEKKEELSKYQQKLSLLGLKFGKNVLDATNAFTLHITDPADLEGLPDYVKEAGASEAKERGLSGWIYTLDFPSWRPFMQYSKKRDLRKKMYMAYGTRCTGGEFDNRNIISGIIDQRIHIAKLLGYDTPADMAVQDRMAQTKENVNSFLKRLLDRSLPFGKKDVEAIREYAAEKGFDGELMPWDFPYFSRAMKDEKYDLNDNMLKPYFELKEVQKAVFGLAERLYGLKFSETDDIPKYHPDVHVYDVTDENGKHLALFYSDFYPRAGKHGGAWTTEFGEAYINPSGEEVRPFVSIVCNFTKPTDTKPSLLTFSEVTTLLHEFGHSLHAIMAEGKYPSLTGTNVARDFVELPSQIMENWASEPEYLCSWAKHYETGKPIPEDLIKKIIASRNYLSGYASVRQLTFGICDMAWHCMESLPDNFTGEKVTDFEQEAAEGTHLLPAAPGTAFCPTFSHIFAGGYAAGYYSYKWSEVLSADAFELFKEKGIFNRDVAGSFRKEILSKGNLRDANILYKAFRGRDPNEEALFRNLGMKN